jgi:hypothetical protein
MSDRTAFSMIVWECPDPKQAQAIMEIIEQESLTIEWGSAMPGDTLELGVQYTDDEIPCGIVDRIASHLVQIAPDAIWDMHEDPKYEWLGEYAAHVPGLGLYQHECDAEGNPQLGHSEIMSIIDSRIHTANQWATSGYIEVDEIRAAFNLATGSAWQERIAGIASPPKPKPADPEEIEKTTTVLKEIHNRRRRGA